MKNSKPKGDSKLGWPHKLCQLSSTARSAKPSQPPSVPKLPVEARLLSPCRSPRARPCRTEMVGEKPLNPVPASCTTSPSLTGDRRFQPGMGSSPRRHGDVRDLADPRSQTRARIKNDIRASRQISNSRGCTSPARETEQRSPLTVSRDSRMASTSRNNVNNFQKMGNASHRSDGDELGPCGAAVRQPRQDGSECSSSRRIQPRMTLLAGITPEHGDGSVPNSSFSVGEGTLEARHQESCPLSSLHNSASAPSAGGHVDGSATAASAGDDPGGVEMWGWTHSLTDWTPQQKQLLKSDNQIILWPIFGSKTDKVDVRQSGWRLTSNQDQLALDPVYWVKRVISLSATRQSLCKVNNLFITACGTPKAASRAVLAGWVRGVLADAGIRASAGSVRPAVAPKHWALNYPLDDILARGNWRSQNTFLNYYCREIRSSPSQTNVVSAMFSPIAN
ncbi:uncharacterized protein LOC125488550 [Plutella xylostella]|uniref:uncharacterized protein LOC125488550 n=1 Tax=Plutella xylostella TaxID=51655 RepID=UPI0020327A94|nr:uncharacterized protein LOC125488550 [Plutella xylostella]